MRLALDSTRPTPLHIPAEALNAAAPLRGCALMQVAHTHEPPLTPAVYPKHRTTIREVVTCTFLPHEERPCSLGGTRPFRKRVLNCVDAEVGEQSQEAQEIREWVIQLSLPAVSSLAWDVPIRNIRIAKRKPLNDDVENGRTRKRVLPAQPTPPAEHLRKLATQCRRLYVATVRVLVSEDGKTSKLEDRGLLEVSIERWDEHGRVRTSVVARDIHGDVRMAFSLIKGRRTSILDGPGSAEFVVATKGDRRGSTWQAVVFRLESTVERKALQYALEAMGEEEVDTEPAPRPVSSGIASEP